MHAELITIYLFIPLTNIKSSKTLQFLSVFSTVQYQYALSKRMDLDLDVILDEIGEFGRYQKVKYFLLCIPVFFGAANSLSYVFTAGVQHYR